MIKCVLSDLLLFVKDSMDLGAWEHPQKVPRAQYVFAFTTFLWIIHKEVILLPYVRQKSLYRNCYSTFNRESLKWIYCI